MIETELLHLSLPDNPLRPTACGLRHGEYNLSTAWPEAMTESPASLVGEDRRYVEHCPKCLETIR